MYFKKIKIIFLILICLSLITVWIAIEKSNIRHSLLPADQSHFPWQAWVNAGANQGSPAKIELRESTYNLSVDFTLPGDSLYPYANLGLTWDEKLLGYLLDWSEYSTIHLKIKCRPVNTLIFLLYSYEESITQIADITSYRPSESLISCNENWQEVRLELNALNSSSWWLESHQMDLANKKIRMDKVRGFSIINSFHSPKDVVSSVAIESITLEGRSHFWIYLAIGVVAAVWSAFCFWAIPLLISSHKPSTSSNQMVIQPVNIEPKHQREKTALLDYLAEAYVNPDLSLEHTANSLGINRTKINQILRECTGLTFTAYLSKLRLTEAARLLVEKKMGVAEAAFAVGFGSISYFNRMFKKEFGCAPSAYKPDNDREDS